FVERIHRARAARGPSKRLTDGAMAALMDFQWPGNIRELRSALEHAMVFSDGPVIDVGALPTELSTRLPSMIAPEPAKEAGNEAQPVYGEARSQLLRDFDRRYVTKLLKDCAGNLSEASRRSGIDRSNLRRMMKQLGIASGASG